MDEVRVRLAQRPPDTAFTASEAAIYTGRSTRTLKRAIDAGVGPKREKNPDISGLGATNRHTRYRKADLDAWRESLVAFATEFRSFSDLALDAPWVMEDSRLVGHLMDLGSAEAVLDTLDADAVVFLRLDEALLRAWSSVDLRRGYQEVFEAICGEIVQTTAAALQRDIMEHDTGEVSEKNAPPVRP
ncbi:helix-turn-helix domain-containing protein [Luteimonas sp. RD2P54]|uniref:Helix-turn-helix domain-containing protein n=1 Tax=Luteimonas endophytica TaxID=3042023 RepID=A0ABT6JBQ3_9GAMM|nr:helix-turn-helix domain-containing protein [Luteimonas endophytica]MDH5824194.1 helix-turn-helix domain-containing protein [Luteimonas endophytica]